MKTARSRWRTVSPVALGGLLAVALSVGGCGSSTPIPHEARIPDNNRFVVRTLPWGAGPIKSPRSIVIGTETGYCVGDPKPRILRAKPRYVMEDVYIQAEVFFPKMKPSNGRLCAGVGLFIRKTVRLNRDLDDISLYDLSTDPPTQRWPSE